MRTRLCIALGLIACLALPATALGHGPTKTDKKNAAKECRSERGTTDATREAFADKYGTNANHKNAFGKCVSSRARDEQAERRAARKAALRECRAAHKHGKAFGKCVSEQAKKEKAAADKRDRAEIKREHSAAKACADERSTLGVQAFADKYGTSKNKHGQGNAFGKCVSQHAKS